MFRPKQARIVTLLVGIVAAAPPVRAQEAAQSEREAMYYRYLEIASYVKGGNVDTNWMSDGSSFRYD